MQIRLLAILPLLVPAALAQTSHALPLPQYATTWGGNNGTGTVFGGTKGIAQTLFIAPFATNRKVVSVGFRRTAGTTDYPGLTLDLDVLLSSTTATLATLSSTFASNLGGDATTVVPRMNYNIPARAATSSANAWVDLPANAPWVFNGPNLIVQVKVYGPTWTSTGYRTDRIFERTGAGESITYGVGCGSATASTSGTYSQGGSVTFSLSAAPASQPAQLMVGFDLTNWLSLPLPFDLSVLGMTNCWLLTPPDLGFAATTSASGTASFTVPVPASGFANVSIGAQWLYFDPNATPTPLRTTNARQVTIGPIIAANRYVYDLFDETVATGTLQAGGPTARLMTTN